MLRVLFLSMLATVPSSSNYVLQTYDFGNGGSNSSSSSYHVRASTGGASGVVTSSSYTLPAGIRASSSVAVPAAPSFTNPDSSYDRLKLVITPGSAPNDVGFAIAISSDNFATTKYVQPDQTIGTNFSASNYQTYAAWGGASGFWVMGLANSTTYKVKVAALQGSATGSAFGPTASAATVAPTVSLALSTSLTSTPPFSTALSNMTIGSVTSGSATITATITANPENGGSVLIHDQNAGLTSSQASYTLASASADLSAVAKGYGAQLSATSQSSGGPLVALSPYNGTGNTVGSLTTTWQPLASFAAPITNGSLTFALKAKTDTTVPAVSDYADSVTLSISLVF